MKKYGLVAALGLTFFLTGCEEVKSVDWWQSHVDDATKKVAECKKSGSDSENCKNAKEGLFREGANKQVISSQADSLIKISRIWADFFPANTS
ncbi:EexN family lipoprotein, partial [Klebsiella pneumoniae]